MNEPLRKISAFIFLYCTLLKETKRVRGMVRMNQQDAEIFEHMLTEEERIEYKIIIEEIKIFLSKPEVRNILKTLAMSINDFMQELSVKDLESLYKEIQKFTLTDEKIRP